MNTELNHDDWTKLDLPALGWEGADMTVKDASNTTIGLVLDAELNSPDGRSPWFLLAIDGEMLLCTLPQGDTLSHLYHIEGAP